MTARTAGHAALRFVRRLRGLGRRLPLGLAALLLTAVLPPQPSHGQDAAPHLPLGLPSPSGVYPPPSLPLSLAPPVTPAAAAPWGEGRPPGVDLDLLYIERTPKYERYLVVYQDGAPQLQEGSAAAQRWPQEGEIVTFAAHVMNKGTERSGPFTAAWRIDGETVQEVSGPPLWPNEEAVFTYQWPWDHELDGERLLGAHTVGLALDPADLIAETFEDNNELEDRTDAAALHLAVTPEVYAALDNQPRPGRSFSAEDWLQRHAQALNEALANSVHPSSPDGVGLRVRIDKIDIAWAPPTVDPAYDGAWFVAADYRSASGYYHPQQDLDWGMLHEWGHQLGAIDTYRYEVRADTVDVLRADGRAYAGGYTLGGDGLMDTAARLELSPYSAAGLNATLGYRRGYYGEYQYDLPPRITLALRSPDGCPVSQAAVFFHQRDAAPASPGGERRIDNVPEWSGVTDDQGRLRLPAQPIAAEITTATGHTLAANPLGAIDVVGSGNIGLLKLQSGEHEQFAWLAAPALNLAFWRSGGKAHEFEITWEGPVDGATCVGGVGGGAARLYLPLTAR